MRSRRGKEEVGIFHVNTLLLPVGFYMLYKTHHASKENTSYILPACGVSDMELGMGRMKERNCLSNIIQPHLVRFLNIYNCFDKISLLKALIQ